MAACVPAPEEGALLSQTRRTGERAVWGGTAGDTVSSMVTVSQGEKDTPGLTDTPVPHRLGPQRAGRVHKLFHLSSEDEAGQRVVRKPLNKDGGKPGATLPGLSVFVSCSAPRPVAQAARKKRRSRANKDEAAERRRPKKGATVRPPRDAGGPLGELLPLSLSPARNETF